MRSSVLLACVTQTCSAITEAVTYLVGLRYFPLTFRRQEAFLRSYIAVLPTIPSLQTSIHLGEAFRHPELIWVVQ